MTGKGNKRDVKSRHRGTAPAVSLLFGFLRVGIPLLVIAVGAYLFLNYRMEWKGSIRVTTSVPGADILIGGSQTGYSSDTTFDIGAGRKIITVRKPGYVSDPEFQIVEVQKGMQNRVNFVLKDSSSAVPMDAIPPMRQARAETLSTGLPMHSIPPASWRRERALVDFSHRSDDTESLRTPSVGRYPEPAATTSDVAGGDLLSISDSLLGTQVTVTSTPDSATVWVNGSPSSKVTPYTFRGLNRGVFLFKVKRDGYVARPDSVSISLSRSYQSELLAFELAPDESLPRPALTISTDPLAAGFRLDGKPAGVGKATIETSFGSHRIEFADAPGYKTPSPVTVTLTSEQPQTEVIGRYERLIGNSFIAVVPSDELDKFDGSALRIYVDNELMLDHPKQKFGAALIGRILSGKRLIRIQYGDLTNDVQINLLDGEVAEITLRVESFFSKRTLRLRDKPLAPLDQWQEKSKRLTVLSVT
jgi:hypothetical protein